MQEIPDPITKLTWDNAALISPATQVFDALGARVGSEILVNTATNSSQVNPEITPLSNGGFAVTWKSWNGSDYDIHARVFAADGTPAQVVGDYLATLDQLSDGRFVLEVANDPNWLLLRLEKIEAEMRRIIKAKKPFYREELDRDAAHRLFESMGEKYKLELLSAIPPTVRSIAVLDRTKEPGAVGEPLYLSVLAALTEAADKPLASAPLTAL